MTTKFRGGMGELMRQASRLQRKVERRKEELKTQAESAGLPPAQPSVVDPQAA